LTAATASRRGSNVTITEITYHSFAIEERDVQILMNLEIKLKWYTFGME
jgi:hypothetical protein